MGILKPVLILAILSSVFLCSNALATPPPPRVGATPDQPKPEAKPDAKPDAKSDAKSDAKPAPAKKHVKRRSVRQNIDATPPSSVPPQSYAPRLPPVPPPVGVPPPSGPQILNGCTGPACLDASGAQYHGGVGTTLIGPQGRVCSNNGITVQCF